MRTITLSTAAKITGETEQSLRHLRHVHPGLKRLGTNVGRTVELELGEVAVFGLVSEFTRRSRTIHQAVEAAFAWMPQLNAVFLGSDRPAENHYAIEVHHPNGTKSNILAVGDGELGLAAQMARDAASISIVSLSRLATEIQTGWIIANLGLDEARRELDRAMEGQPAELREAQLAMLDAIAARLQLPPPATRGHYIAGEPPPLSVAEVQAAAKVDAR